MDFTTGMPACARNGKRGRVKNKSSGFTLIELMIVVIILAALAGMVLPRIMDRADDAKINIARGEIAAITTALQFYRLDHGRYPEALSALMTATGKGPYLEKAPKDPWGRSYQYRFPGERNPSGFDLWSPGPDESSPAGIIANWDR